MKKRWLVASFVLFSACTYAQQSVPVIRFDSVPDPIKLPKDMYLGEDATFYCENCKDDSMFHFNDFSKVLDISKLPSMQADED